MAFAGAWEHGKHENGVGRPKEVPTFFLGTRLFPTRRLPWGWGLWARS